MYLKDFDDEPSLGNLHFSTYLSWEMSGNCSTKEDKQEITKMNNAYLVVGPSQFLAFPSFTE